VITAFGAKPVEPKPAEVVAPKTLAEADGHCRGIEQKVIEFYDKLIADCPDEGIRQVLQRIQTANHRHLQAVGG
jgi:rubrerythrin